MTKVIELLLSTFHPATGSVRTGEVVEVPDELAAHWTNNNIAKDAEGQEVTRNTATEAPTGQDGPNEFGQWPEARALGEPDPAAAPGAGRFSSMIGRREAGMAAPATPTPADGQPGVAEPTSGPMTASATDPNANIPTTAEGQPTVAEPTSGPMHGADEQPAPPAAETNATAAPAGQPSPTATTTNVPFTAEGTMHAESETPTAEPAPEPAPSTAANPVNPGVPPA